MRATRPVRDPLEVLEAKRAGTAAAEEGGSGGLIADGVQGIAEL